MFAPAHNLFHITIAAGICLRWTRHCSCHPSYCYMVGQTQHCATQKAQADGEQISNCCMDQSARASTLWESLVGPTFFLGLSMLYLPCALAFSPLRHPNLKSLGSKDHVVEQTLARLFPHYLPAQFPATSIAVEAFLSRLSTTEGGVRVRRNDDCALCLAFVDSPP